MSGQWEPGTVARATVRGRANCLVMRAFATRGNRGWFVPEYEARDEYRWYSDVTGHVTDVRPLVLLDPEDWDQVQSLVQSYEDQRHSDCGSVTCFTDTLRDALRSLVRPPKPEEPQGLGAVVEDAEGFVFVRQCGTNGETDMSYPWLLLASGRRPMPEARWVERSYRDIDAVKVLSDGVQP